ncbi:hypothetical protein GpartN1_g5022.t1 [Galdieria partita]|uniref:Ribosomal RNA-processing protein 8 n=1 Tax=Galdieria partita TaxID=83374 RepID=A0A9C7Q0F5_9RHOD|nr:hypothetical protein GpartN1_g5022.t1 [Galdieria partita]
MRHSNNATRCQKKTRKGVATREDLASSCFRWINQRLYTSSSEQAQQLFQKDPLLFQVYHNGYQRQLEKWPQKPLEFCLDWLQQYFQENKNCVVADFGCGKSAQLEEQLNGPNRKFYSFDLVKTQDPRVIPCNVTHLPLRNKSVDVVVCCLSLMGTDYAKIIQEAHRILKKSGVLIIAEVTSRLQGILDIFCRRIAQIGFREHLRNTSNSFFVFLVFQKSNESGQPTTTNTTRKNITLPQLKPCLYKKR